MQFFNRRKSTANRPSFTILKSFFKTAEREKAVEIETTARPPTQPHIQKYVTDDNFSKSAPPLNQDSYCYYYCGGRERLDCARLRRQRAECTYTIVIIFICITVPVVVQLFADTALWNIDGRGQVSSSQVTVSAFSVRPLNLEQHSPAVSLLLSAITSNRLNPSSNHHNNFGFPLRLNINERKSIKITGTTRSFYILGIVQRVYVCVNRLLSSVFFFFTWCANRKINPPPPAAKI